jgi:hypothetical protein
MHLRRCSGSLRRSSPPRQEFHFMVTERGADTPRSAGYATIYRCFRGDISEELIMTRSILISLAILTLSTSVALAAQRTHHSRAVKPNASTAAMNPNPYARPMYPNAFAGGGPSPVVWTGGVSSSDRDQYVKNLRDSGYDRKKDFNPNGTVRTQ